MSACTLTFRVVALILLSAAHTHASEHVLLRRRQLQKTAAQNKVTNEIPVDKLFFPHDRKGASYSFAYSGALEPDAFDLFNRRVRHDKKTTYSSKADVTLHIYTATLASPPPPSPPTFDDYPKPDVNTGDVVALCTCEPGGYLAAMNVLARFNGDKISSELAAQCYTWHKSLGIEHPHVRNVGGKGGALSYTRGALTAGYRFWSQDGRSGPYTALPTTKNGDIDRDELFRDGVPSTMYFSEAAAERKGPARKDINEIVAAIPNEVLQGASDTTYRPASRSRGHRRLEDIFGTD